MPKIELNSNITMEWGSDYQHPKQADFSIGDELVTLTLEEVQQLQMFLRIFVNENTDEVDY